MRTLLQLLVVYGNRVKVIRSLNRIPYSLAMRSFVGLISKLSEVESIYLRHGLLRADWIPGISDIDLTVVIKPGLDDSQEYMLLRSLWRRYGLVRSLFPMLGELQIIDRLSLQEWRRIGVRGRESSQWRLLAGDEVRPEKDDEFLWEESLDSLWYALVLYLGVFTRILNDRFQPETLVVQRLRRLAAKIRRYCGSPLKSDPPGNTRLQILKGVLIALEKAVAGVRVSDPASSPKPLAQPGCTFSSDTFLLDESVIDRLTVSNRDCFLILVSGPGKDFDSESLKPCLAELKVKLDLQVTILTMRTWGFILRYVTPAKYSELAQERRVLMGRDPFRQISTPPRASYVRHLVHQISQVLNYRFDLAHRLTGSGFQIAVIRALSTMLYLEHRQVVPNYTQRLRRIEAHYPEDFRRFQELLARVGFELNERNHYDCFVFFRGVAEKVRQAFSTWEPAKIEKCASGK